MGSIELITDCSELVGILNDPEMLERICEDGQEIEFTTDTVGAMEDAGYLLGWFVDGELTGFYWVHQFNYSVLQVHAHFLKQNRMFAKHSGRAMLKWLQNNVPDQFKRFIAMIPDCYPDVIGFSVREGLEVAGKIERASFRNGQCYDVTVLGVDRGGV